MLNMLDIAIGFATVMLAVSLIIMSLTQAVASLLALRGARLRRGLEELIKNAVPSLANDAKTLSAQILQHPLVSDSAVTRSSRWGWASTIKREELIPVLRAVLKQAGKVDLVAAEEQRIEQWFDSFMARVSQWFVMNTRWITVGFAVILAFVMHLDTIDILKQLQNDSETRAKLSAMSASLLDQTPAAIETVQTQNFLTLQELAKGNAAQFKSDATPDAAVITNSDQAHEFIKEQALSPAAAETLTKTFDDQLAERLSSSLDKSINRALTLRDQLTSAGIAFMPPNHHRGDYFDTTRSELWGILASVLFLSLGAPFWFNVLKSMTSLKSAVAQKEESSDQRAPGQPADGTRGLQRPGQDRLPDLS